MIKFIATWVLCSLSLNGLFLLFGYNNKILLFLCWLLCLIPILEYYVIGWIDSYLERVNNNERN